MSISFDSFIASVAPQYQDFVTALHHELLNQGCGLNIKEAKRGYAVSYQWNKKTVMNWVFRKNGVMARIYGDHVGEYEAVVASLPEDMRKMMTSARDCKRLQDPAACSDTCVKGFVFQLEEETYKKCRNGGMFFLLTEENSPYIRSLVEAEVKVRQAISKNG